MTRGIWGLTWFGQVTGPITFCTGISDEEKRPLYGGAELPDAATKLLPPSCCAGSLSPEDARRVFDLLGQLHRKLAG